MNNPNGQTQFTAAEISNRSGSISRQGVAKLLRGIPADAVRVARGNQETLAWAFASLSRCAALLERLESDARRQGYRNVEALLASPLPPPERTSLRELADEEINRAAQLRAVLLPALRESTRPAAERDALIVARYGDAFGHVVTPDYARKLYHRTVRRDAGQGDFGKLELYLPDHPKRKAAPEWTATASNLADLLPALESRLASITTPGRPPKPVVRAVWHVAFEEYARLIAGGADATRTARQVRDFLHARAPFLPRHRDALLKTWNAKLTRWLTREGMPGALADLRSRNGRPLIVPEADIARLRHSTMKHSGRLDCAWREEYGQLSESSRSLGTKDGRCPRVVVSACNRVILDGLAARRQGKRYLEKLLGSITRNVESIPSMYAWAMDDLTCTLEVFVTNPDGTTSLRLVQFIAVMDVRSRKFVGYALSLDEAPNAELVTEAFLDAVRRTGMVPHHLFLENGWVFGRANNIVGKRNESGEVIIAGLAEYGCQVHHFDPMTPTSKGELEKAFDLLQRLMERHPGYTGRAQRYDAPEQFRREQIEMRRNSNPRDPATCRYDFSQGARAIDGMVNQYNATKQHGALKAMAPDDAFAAFMDHANPPISLPPKLHWLLASRYRVTVTLSGVKFRHFGTDIRVRGGNLVNHAGRELWAVLDRRAPDCVTFMALNFEDVFTEPLRPVVDYDESETSPGSGALATEYETKAQMRGVVEDEYQGLMARFGDPRVDLLRQAQAESEALAGRVPVIDPNHEAAGIEGQRQRAELRSRARTKSIRNGAAALAQAHGLPDYVAARPGAEEAIKSLYRQKGLKT